MSYSSKHAQRYNFSISATADVSMSAGDSFPRGAPSPPKQAGGSPPIQEELKNWSSAFWCLSGLPFYLGGG